MPGKCNFSDLWLEREEYKRWLEAIPNSAYQFRCKLCCVTRQLENMGESALTSHMKGARHIKLLAISKMQKSVFDCGKVPILLQQPSEELQASASLPMSVPSTSQVSVPLSSQVPALSSKPKSISDFMAGKEVLTAEVLWALKCVTSNYSYNSCSEVGDVLKMMFTDSNIAKQFTLSPAKCAYLCCFGIAPHFKDLLIKLVDKGHFTVLFDETLNKSTQSKQMDLFVRFWHPNLNQVCTRYINSVFLGHSTANDLLNGIKTALSNFNMGNIVQLSMDGPAVNWKVYENLQKDLKKKYDHGILNIGTCGLHVLHNAFKAGGASSNWQMDVFLINLHRLFKDSPARLQDYYEVSSTGKTALKFCRHRWLDSLPAIKRAIEILEDLKSFISCVEKKKFPNPNNHTYNSIKSFLKDELLIVKLHFLSSVASLVQPFLTKYQTEKPVLPFFAADLTKLVRSCLLNYKILKDGVIKNITVSKLSRFEFKTDMLNSIAKIETGFTGEKLLKNLTEQKSVKESDVVALKQEIRDFICAMIKKIIEKSPINYSIVRNASCLNPVKIARNKEICISQMKSIVNSFQENGWIPEDECETTLLDYQDFLETTNLSVFMGFNESTDRLDDFFYDHMFAKGHLKAFHVIKLVLLLSHGQASVERGFSINKNMEVENLKEHSYISLRMIKDHVEYCGGVLKVAITKELLSSASSGRQRYMMYLKDLQKEKEKCITENKKRKFEEELVELKKKKKCLEVDIKELSDSADELSLKAECTKKMTFCVQSNSLRRTVKEKQAEVKILDDKIEEAVKKLKG